MDKIDLPEHDIVPLDAVTPDVHGLRIVFVNVFGVRHAGGWTLVDAGIPYSASYIRRWAEQTFGQPPNAILLTHGHFDHVSAAGELAGQWDVPVYAHELELPYLTGRQEYPAPDFAQGGGAMAWLSPLYPRGPVDLGDRLRPLPAEGGERVLPGWQVLHTPGHTAGHVSFFREQDRTLMVGDAFCTTKPESFFAAAGAQPAALHGPPSYFTADWAQARESVRKLAALRPETLAPGHGKSLAGAEVPQALQRLAERFDEVAIPNTSKARESAA